MKIDLFHLPRNKIDVSAMTKYLILAAIAVTISVVAHRYGLMLLAISSATQNGFI
jgi:hypothetical protein